MAADAGFSRRLVAALALSSMLTPLNSTMLSVVLGPIGAEFHASETLLTQALVTSYLIMSIVMQAPSGKLGDRFGHRRAVAVGQGLFALGSLCAMFAPSTVMLALARIVMATGGALIVPSAGALLRLEVPPEKRGQAFGAFGASMALSAAIGPVIGDPIAAAISWRATFAVNLVVLPIAVLLAGRTEPKIATSTKPFRFDVLGSLMLGSALTLAVVGSNAHAGHNRPYLYGASALVTALFVAWEKRHAEPVVDLGLLRRPVFVAGGLVVALQNLAMYALLFELPGAMSRVGGAGHGSKGLMLGAMMLAMVIISPISGRLADAFGARRIATTGALLALLGMMLLYAFGLGSLTRLVPALALFGVGLGLTSSPAQASAMSAAPKEESGMAAALLATMRYLGGIAGIVVLSLVWTAPSDPAQVVAEHRSALLVFGAALATAVLVTLVLPKEAPGRMD